MSIYNSTNEIKRTAYSKYQLDWMSSHGYGLNDIISRLNDTESDRSYSSVKAVFEEWEYNEGFDGELWVCYKEFISSEYKDMSYMKKILDDDQYAQYLEDIGERDAVLSVKNVLSVETPLGRIYAQYNGNPDYPGILVSAGRDEDFANTPGCLIEYSPDKNCIQTAVYAEGDEPKQIFTFIEG